MTLGNAGPAPSTPRMLMFPLQEEGRALLLDRDDPKR